MSGRGIEVVVDATKELLVNVLEYHPFLIKPNHHELGEVFGVELKTREDVIPYARRMQQMGARNVLVSMAAAGAVLVAEDKSVYETDAPKGILVNGVGAGDSWLRDFLQDGWRKKNIVMRLPLAFLREAPVRFRNDLQRKKRSWICIGENLPDHERFFGEKICRPCTKEHKYPCTWPAGLFFV